MNMPKLCLLLGGIVSFLIVLLHLALALRPHWYHRFGAGELVQLHEQGSPSTVFATFGLALMFAPWAAYALSGAGIIGQLPLLRAVLKAIGVIYILRGLMLPSELFKDLLRGYPFRFLVFSTGSLAAGPLYLVGTLAR